MDYSALKKPIMKSPLNSLSRNNSTSYVKLPEITSPRNDRVEILPIQSVISQLSPKNTYKIELVKPNSIDFGPPSVNKKSRNICMSITPGRKRGPDTEATDNSVALKS